MRMLTTRRTLITVATVAAAWAAGAAPIWCY
ncbi:MAG: twin-arginine translocation signal domain-containing protein [Actinomycetia bacterium]|nr:twin-arginine translocation signal domain-containing protein [Actinomycetes bacterium]